MPIAVRLPPASSQHLQDPVELRHDGGQPARLRLGDLGPATSVDDEARADDSRVGALELAITRTRTGSYYPDWLLEPRRRVEPGHGRDATGRRSPRGSRARITSVKRIAASASMNEGIWRAAPRSHPRSWLARAGIVVGGRSRDAGATMLDDDQPRITRRSPTGHRPAG